MSSPILSALCRPVSTGFHRLTSINQLPKCWTFERHLSCSRQFIHSSDKPGSSSSSSSLSSRLNAHTHKRMSSTSWGISSSTFPVCRGARLSGERSIHEGPRKYLTTCRLISVSAEHLAKKAEFVTIHFINRDGEKITVKGKTGQNLLDTVLDNDLDIDGYGACEGTLSCSTCHLIISEDRFPKLLKPSDEELDMLDLAYGQTDMSRLGCQVILTKEMDGMTVVVPEGVADARDV